MVSRWGDNTPARQRSDRCQHCQALDEHWSGAEPRQQRGNYHWPSVNQAHLLIWWFSRFLKMTLLMTMTLKLVKRRCTIKIKRILLPWPTLQLLSITYLWCLKSFNVTSTFLMKIGHEWTVTDCSSEIGNYSRLIWERRSNGSRDQPNQ